MGYKLMKSKLALAALAGTSVLTLAATPAFAAHKGSTGGRTGSGSSSLTVVNETSPGTPPAYGQTITFKLSTTASQPFVSVDCYQGGPLVYSSSAGFFAGYPWPWQQNFVLSSGAWTGGAASCTATLYTASGGGQTSNLATLNFGVTA